MDLKELKERLAECTNNETHIEILLPDGSAIPAHFHVTEVGQVRKDFIDCGGQKRTKTECIIQTWVANDVDHRVSAEKFLKILNLADEVLVGDFLPVEIEYQDVQISQFPLERVTLYEDRIQLHTKPKFTDCLAKDKCGIPEDWDKDAAQEANACCGLDGCC